MERCRVFRNRRGSKNPGSFLFLVKATSPVLSGLTDRPSPPHHSSTVCWAHCISPDTLLGNFPIARRQMLSAYPCAYTLPSLSLTSKLSTTRHHKRGDKTPPLGQPLDTATLLVTFVRAAVVSRPSRVALIHRAMVQSSPCLANADHMES